VTRARTDPDAAELELRGITKRFGHVTALSGVDLFGYPGSVLAVVGDNGAGKSTLIKIIAGVHRPDAGEIRIAGSPMVLRSAADARQAGVATVFQDLALVEVLDVSTNMFLGQLPRRGWFVDRAAMDAESRAFLDGLKVTIASVRTEVGMLSGGQRQIIAVARAMRTGAQIVLLDEPTAALGVRETAHAVGLIRELRDRGNTVICVSHDMTFVFDVADRVQVMRLGQVAGVRTVSDTSKDEVIGLITGSVSDRPIEEQL
jgi:ABC-type sugar transport system ATPase subunit